MSTTFISPQSSNPGLLDATGRLRVSQATTLHRAAFLYDKDPLRWAESLSGGAAAVFSQDKASVLLQIPAASGSFVVRQTKEYFQYVPAKSQMIDASFKAWPQEAGLIQRVGYFDDENGLFLSLEDQNEPLLVRRERTTGSVINHAVQQSNWNLDRLDGTGPSGLTIDFNLPQLLIVDFQWLGLGIIRMGFALSDGSAVPKITYTHQFFAANLLSEVTISTPKLPVRYEIRSTAPLSGPATLQQICSSVASEGGVSERRTYGIDRGISGQPIVNTLRPLLSIRPNISPNRVRAALRVRAVRVSSSSGANLLYRLLLNPTITGGAAPAWQDIPNSNCQFDLARDGTIPISVTAAGAGTVLSSGYGSDNIDQVLERLTELLPAAADIAGAPDEIVLAAANVAGGTETVFGGLEVVET